MRLLTLFLAFQLSLCFAYSQSKTVTNLSDTGTGSLRATIDSAVAGDTIKFESTLLNHGQNDTIFLFSDILIDKGLYIQGLDHDSAKIFISGSDSTRIFRVDVSNSTNKTLTLHDVYFTNTKAVTNFGDGGALLILQLDTLKVKNCQFRKCHATDEGGAIYSRSYTLAPIPKYTEFTNCKFSQNTAQGNNAGHMEFYQTGPIYINNCEFSENAKNGSIIEFCDGLYIENSIIRNNGGPIANSVCRAFIVSQTDTLYANNILAYNNHSSWESPVFFLGYIAGTLIENSVFFDNHSDQSGVFGASSHITLRNCQFYDNQAKWGGVTNSEKINFEQCIFKGNKATNYGGVLFNTGNNTGRYCHFYECELDSNSSGSDGGAIFISHSNFRLERSSATHNTSGGEGGAFRIMGFAGSAVFSHSTVAKNHSVGKGGALSLGNVDSVKIKNSTFAYNQSAISGDFAYFSWTDSIEIEGSIIINHGNPFSYYAQTPPIKIVSEGYNILEFDHANLLSSDIPNIDSSYHILDSLTVHGGIGKVMLPLPKTLAVNRGNPLDMSLAQNGTIKANIRDIGAAESKDSTIVSAQSLSICDSIFLNGAWRYTIGTFIDTTLSTSGPDSISYVWIKNVNTAIIDTQNVKSCDSYTWINGITYSNSSDTAQMTFTSASGCDSIIVLDYTRLTTSYSDTQKVVNACSPFTWIDGNVYTMDTDTASIAYNSVHNCDSTIYLDLKLTKIDTIIVLNNNILTALDSTAQYQWVDCDQNYSSLPNGNQQQYTIVNNGTYAVILSKNTCVDTSTCIEMQNFSTVYEPNPSISAFPNPTDGKLHLDFGKTTVVTSIKIYNLLGGLIHNYSVESNELIEIELDQPSGIYFIEVMDDSNHSTYFRILKR